MYSKSKCENRAHLVMYSKANCQVAKVRQNVKID